jgi:hypothetical protein
MLEPGDPLPHFMETEIREAEKVLIICTPHHKQKSEARKGGVGYEEGIITAEVLDGGNHRKFIPILRDGDIASAIPTSLRGKLFIDLRSDSEAQYQELISTLEGSRPQAPPVSEPRRDRQAKTTHPPVLAAYHHIEQPQQQSEVASPPATEPPAPVVAYHQLKPESITGKVRVRPSEHFEPIRITELIESEVGRPRNDGTPGSALYAVPFRLSRRPPHEWADLFVRHWNRPSSWTNMHRAGIASVSGDRVVLDGTTLDEVAQYHKKTLLLAQDAANRDYVEWLARREREEEREAVRSRQQDDAIRQAAKRITFD